MPLNGPIKFSWSTKEEKAVLNPPVINTRYTVFNEVGGVRLIRFQIFQDNTETDAKEVDIILTIDGTEYLYDSSAIDSLNNLAVYSLYLSPSPSDPNYQLGIGSDYPFVIGMTGTNNGFPFEAHTLKLEVRLTNAAGTAQKITYKAVYAILEAL